MKKPDKMAGGLLFGSVLLITASPSLAQGNLSEDVVRCGTISDNSARLSCFDALLPNARQSDAERRAEIEKREAAEFGLSATQRNEQAKHDDTEDKENHQVVRRSEPRVDSTIAAVDIGRLGTIFTLANGQVWQTTSFGSLYVVPHVGQKVTIISGPLGGYRLTLGDSEREVGVKRLK